MNSELEYGRLYSIIAIDLTSHENEAWFSSEQVLEITPEIVSIVGHFVGENHECFYFSQAMCDDHHANLFIVPKGQIRTITRL